MKKFIINLILFSLIIFSIQLVLSLEWKIDYQNKKIPYITVKIPDPNFYKPQEEVKKVQQYLKADSVVGFLWKENIDSNKNVRFKWGDQEPCILTTDKWGFVNSPEAILDISKGKRVNIVGIGASFMQGAASSFYDFFSLYDLFYYNMATHRHTFPMFNDVLKEYAIKLKPQWIIYELNEASPSLIADYIEWKKSKQDWFTFHSGTWSGPPKSSQYDLGLLKKFKNLNAIAIAFIKKIFPKKPIPVNNLEEQKKLTLKYILEADSILKANNVNLIVLYIPSKETIFYKKSKMSNLIDDILLTLEEKKITTLDLRKVFNESGDPVSLYYPIDGHWNKDGMLITARALKDIIKQTSDFK
jgi:hypothetical protein